MPAKRTTMRKIRDILRLRHHAGLSIRQINASTKVSVGSIQTLLEKARELEVSWPLPDDMDDARLAGLFYPDADTRRSSRHQIPNWPTIQQELKQDGVTKQLVWEEYTQQYPNRCYSYSQFCDRYLHWVKKLKRSMRQLHRSIYAWYGVSCVFYLKCAVHRSLMLALLAGIPVMYVGVCEFSHRLTDR